MSGIRRSFIVIQLNCDTVCLHKPLANGQICTISPTTKERMIGFRGLTSTFTESSGFSRVTMLLIYRI